MKKTAFHIKFFSFVVFFFLHWIPYQSQAQEFVIHDSCQSFRGLLNQAMSEVASSIDRCQVFPTDDFRSVLHGQRITILCASSEEMRQQCNSIHFQNFNACGSEDSDGKKMVLRQSYLDRVLQNQTIQNRRTLNETFFHELLHLHGHFDNQTPEMHNLHSVGSDQRDHVVFWSRHCFSRTSLLNELLAEPEPSLENFISNPDKTINTENSCTRLIPDQIEHRQELCSLYRQWKQRLIENQNEQWIPRLISIVDPLWRFSINSTHQPFFNIDTENTHGSMNSSSFQLRWTSTYFSPLELALRLLGYANTYKSFSIETENHLPYFSDFSTPRRLIDQIDQWKNHADEITLNTTPQQPSPAVFREFDDDLNELLNQARRLNSDYQAYLEHFIEIQ